MVKELNKAGSICLGIILSFSVVMLVNRDTEAQI